MASKRKSKVKAKKNTKRVKKPATKRRKRMADKPDPNKPQKAKPGTPLQPPPSQQSALGPVPKPGEPVGGPAQLPEHVASPETRAQTETFPDTEKGTAQK